MHKNELPFIPLETRFAWIQILQSAAKHRANPLCLARAAEDAVYKTRMQKLNIDGLDVCVYGPETTILSFETMQVHAQHAVNHYCAKLRRAAFILCTDEAVIKKDDAWWDLEDDDLAKLTGQADWKHDFLSKQDKARAVLKGEAQTVGLFSCPACKSKNVDTDQKQTRSADEPMTVFCCCNSCGKRFVR